ncbi:hypothetical protein SEA_BEATUSCOMEDENTI_46 [Arthrobacter phage BeatusComedenti]|uniref:Uncharacterized protein n=1 Tax=Arthrobacter phage BeatusComedenti TaxID=2656523 RepID=A0A649VWU8_9CAUD|nr:hypothetical protein SEA_BEATUSCOMEDENTI_46 [Arthrobacter phage BeatusComedenti]
MTTLAEQFQQDFKKAEEVWGVYSGDSTTESVWVEAEAQTGSKYVVMISKVPELMSRSVGATHLVSIIQPWQVCYPIGGLYELTPDYVMEKFRNPSRDPRNVHGGDLAALTKTINYAIGKYEQWCSEEARVAARQEVTL